ncbi:MAG: hypothetical protein RJA24_1710, partial [Pseudomonadota bacterium]
MKLKSPPSYESGAAAGLIHFPGMALNIGLIEDDPSVRKVVCSQLLGMGLRPVPCTQSHQILERVAENNLHLLLVDIGLGDENGIDLIRRVRMISELPIIIISGYGDSKTVAEGLNAGADDYQRKPIAFDELAARIGSVLRRHKISAPENYTVKGYLIGHVRVDFRTRIATGERGDSAFTELEMQILSRLLQHPGKTISRDRLSRELFGANWDPDTRALDVHMTRIRKKLSAAGAPD